MNTSKADLPHILIIDDDTRLRNLISTYLRDNGFVAFGVESAEKARTALADMEFDLIVLDVMMPKEDGHQFLENLREKSQIPVLMLTALGETSDRIKGLAGGADDYLSKPFEPQELVLRIQAITRRTAKDKAKIYQFAGFEFNPNSQQLNKNGESQYLTGSEAELLKILCAQNGEPIEREELAKKIGLNNDRAVDVAIMRLRKKIELDSKKPTIIQTVRGNGYRFNLD
jgi:two-component system phosphate regulon response regulator OmpR